MFSSNPVSLALRLLLMIYTTILISSYLDQKLFLMYTMQYLGSKIWNLIPMKMKLANNLQFFKTNIKTWIPKKLSLVDYAKNYLVGVGFILSSNK